MNSSSLERNSEVTLLCKNILASNDYIFFVSSLNKNGKSTEFQFRNDRIFTKMTKQQTEMFYMQRTLQTSLCAEFDDVLGPLDFITVQRETFLEFMFPYSDGIILVAADLEVIHRFLAKKISFIIQDYEWRKKEFLYA